MNRLKGQKQGGGEAAFGFLDEKPKQSSSSSGAAEDTGFDKYQLQELEESEVVSQSYVCINVVAFC